MKAIAITPGTPGARMIERPPPEIGAADEVELRVLRVGICGTDREEITGGRAQAPAGQTELVIGHEMLGEVAAVGAAVTLVGVGDLAVFTVRRGCGGCPNCGLGRADMCTSGGYRERGIRGADGYQTERVVDVEANLVRLPTALEPVGVLLEPLSIVEKAVAEAVRVQTVRDPEAAITPDWLDGRRCLVAGLGPVGLLAAMVLRLRGAEVYGLDIVPAASARPQWLGALGGHYLTAPPAQMPMDLILDASGVAALEFALLDALAPNGVYVLTGIPAGNRPLAVPAAELMRRLVLRNQLMLGSVNAARGHFQMGVDRLEHAELRWPGQLAKLIRQRRGPEEFLARLAEPAAAEATEIIKEVVEWDRKRP